MRVYKYETKEGWRKSKTFQNDVITMGVNAFNKVVQDELNFSTECVGIDVYHPVGDATKICAVNGNIMLETTRGKLVKEGLIYERK